MRRSPAPWSKFCKGPFPITNIYRGRGLSQCRLLNLENKCWFCKQRTSVWQHFYFVDFVADPLTGCGGLVSVYISYEYKNCAMDISSIMCDVFTVKCVQICYYIYLLFIKADKLTTKHDICEYVYFWNARQITEYNKFLILPKWMMIL